MTGSKLAKRGDGRMVLEIEIDFEPGSKFPCPECGASCGVHDTGGRIRENNVSDRAY